MSQEKSGFLSLNKKDFINGLIMAVIVVVVGGAYTIIGATPGEYGSANDWKLLLHSTVLTVIAYFTKNFFTGNGETK